uniref:Uncharacterized protein n=1 Tax=Alexandrium catenella TaxID=2925 RepID=A0A7S1RKA8_ALECA
MNEPPGKAPVMVFAGYPDDMDAFMKANSGLYRRIAYTFDFTDYSPLDLAQILNGIATSAGFFFNDALTERNFMQLAKLIEENTLQEARELMNGGICERIFTFAKQSLDCREASIGTTTNPSVELLESDVLEACRRIPPPPPRDTAVPSGGGGGGGADGADVSVVRARAEQAEARCAMLQAKLGQAQAELQVLKASGGSGAADPAAAARAEGRASAAEAEAKRSADRSAKLEADLARAKAELDSLQRASAGGAGGTAAVDIARLEGRAAAAEADAVRLAKELADSKEEIEGLRKEVADAREAERAAVQRELAAIRTSTGGADPAGVVKPPKQYEVLPCVTHSAGCLWFFTVLILTWTFRNLVRLFNFLRSKAFGEDKRTAVVPMSTSGDPSAAGTTPGKPGGSGGGPAP